jgi:hypothetical protein
MSLMQSHLIKIWSRVIDKRMLREHTRYLRVLKTGREGILMLPILTTFLVNIVYGSDLDLQGKLWTTNFVMVIVGGKIIIDTERSKSDSGAKTLLLLQKRALVSEYDLTYGTEDR